ncbi:hypothetical protein DBP20_14030 [Streptomyces sp. CS131]|nr:hypothetical protein DBP20_14030 [Streptomyces sp. CS131]
MAGGRIGAKDTGDASAQGGAALSNTGVINGPVTLSSPPRRPAVSGYLLQVERVAAADFRGREAELSELASFSTEERPQEAAGKDYWRWLAPAWAGKSALLAEFVLNPPSGIDIVAFFITSRMAGQNDAAAFCEVVQRQLYALLREEEPLSTPATRDEQLRLAMDRAAERCVAEGRRLVLVVDGLDEDHGVTAGPDCHSIAALLPRTPPHGMRIIVAGRPHPPVPDDVPGDHPLRTTEINHWLAPSPYAQAVRWEAEQNLLRLLDGGGLGRELVGLTVAAGGGLSARDIAELTGSRPRLVERELSAVTGRSFRRRSVHWASHGPEVYLLAHEEIQRSAAELITDTELAHCRTRLHAWAQTYRSAGWPATTPEYLLRGYAQLLRELGDTGRLVELVCDAARHERLWQVTGADLEALSELSTSLDQLLAHGRQSGDLDVSAALRLAAARYGLHERTRALPPELIGLWARLGHTERAVSMAESQRGQPLRSLSYAAVATCLAATGHLERATALADEAETSEQRDHILWSIAQGLVEADRYTEVVGTVSRMDDAETRAEALVSAFKAVAEARTRSKPVEPGVITALAEAATRATTVPGTVAPVGLLADLACAFSLLGDDRKAREATDRVLVASSQDDGRLQALRLSLIAVRLAKAPGLRAKASELALRSAETAAAVNDPHGLDQVVPEIAAGLTAAGHDGRAAALVGRLLSRPDNRSSGLCAIATTLAEFGHWDKALERAGRITDPVHRSKALVSAGRALAKSAEPERTRALARQILDALDELPGRSRRIELLVSTADFLIQAGQEEPGRAAVAAATDLARGSRATAGRVATQIAVARELVSADAGDEANRLIDSAAEAAEAQEAPDRFLSLLEVAGGLHALGLDDRKEALLSALLMELRTKSPRPERAYSIQQIAEVYGETGSPEKAGELAQQLLDSAESQTSPSQQSRYRCRAASAFLAAKNFDKALTLTGELPEGEEVSFLSNLVKKLVEAGDLDRAGRLADAITDACGEEVGLEYVAAGAAAVGHLPRATALLDAISRPALRERSTVAVVQAAARSGAAEEVRGLVEALTDPAHRSKALGAVARSHGPTPTGRLLLVEALTLGPWDQLVEAWAGVAPEQLPLLAVLSRGER